MSWRAVARLEARDARRSRALLTVVVMAAVLGVAAVWLPAIVLGDGLTAERAVAFLIAPLKLAVGLTGLLAGYGAVAGPRTAGQLKLALGLPNARTGLVLGAFVGRSAVVLVGVAVALAIAALLPRPEYATTLATALVLAAFFGTGFNGVSPGVFPGPGWLLNVIPVSLITRLQLYHLVAVDGVVACRFGPPPLPSGPAVLGVVVAYGAGAIAVGAGVIARAVYAGEAGE